MTQQYVCVYKIGHKISFGKCCFKCIQFFLNIVLKLFTHALGAHNHLHNFSNFNNLKYRSHS